MAPLSGKQQREYLKFQNKEAREEAKMGLDEMRKQQLHQIKLQEAAAKANQGLGHKEQVNNAKLKDMGIPAPRMNKQKLGIPTQNPLAGTGMFKQGQRSLPQSPIFKAQGTDTVPAMLTPGEAVIPAPAAQNPKNKKAIKRMVQEGRKANKLRDGSVSIVNSDAPAQARYHADGTSGVPSLAYRHPDVPGSSFNDGTERVFSRGSADMQHYNNGTYGVVPQQVQQAAGYSDGDTNVSYLDRFLNYIAGQEPVKQPIVAPLAQPTSQPSDFNTIIEKVFQREYPSEDKAFHKVKGDKGGATKYGISQRAYPDLDIKNLTKEQAIEIAKRDYWDKNQIDKLDPAIREIHFDTAFNKGSGAAKRFLERSGGDPTKYLEERQKYVDKIVKNNPSQKKFQEGWSNRVKDLGKIADAATDIIIPSAQAGTLDSKEPKAPLSVVKPEVVVNTNLPSGREVLIAKQDLATSSNPRVIQAAKEVLARANQPIPTLADTRAPIFNVAPPDLNKNLTAQKAVTTTNLPVSVDNEIPKPIDISKNEKAIGNDQAYNIALGEGPQTEVPELVGNGLSNKQNVDRFNTLGLESRKELDTISEAVKQATQMQGTPEEKKGFLAKALEGIFGPKGLFNDKELVRFGLLAAGGMLTGGSVGGSLRVAGLNTLQAADRRQAETFAAEQQDKRFNQQEELLDKRIARDRELRREDITREENKALESAMVKEGRDAMEVRNWFKGGQKGEAPQIRTSFIRNGKSELMTVTTPTNLNGQVFKPGDPVWVYETVQQFGPSKGQTVQMVRIGDKSFPFDALMAQGSFLDKWDSNKYGDQAKLKRAQEFSEKLSKNIFEPIVESYFGASNVKGKANPERKGLVTAGSAASQVESFFRGKVNLDDRVVQNEIEKITTIAAEQLANDIESGTFKPTKDITPYLAAGEFRERGKLSDKLVTLDKKSGRLMSADDILALRDSANLFVSKNKINTTPDAEIARLAEVWAANTNGIQNRYKNSDRNTAFALFALDTFKK